MATGKGRQQISVTLETAMVGLIDELADEGGVKRAELLSRLVVTGYSEEARRAYMNALLEYNAMTKEMGEEQREKEADARQERLLEATEGLRGKEERTIARAKAWRDLTAELSEKIGALEAARDEEEARKACY